MRVGFHVSISGGVDRAVDRAAEIWCDVFQVFTRNPRSWKYGELDVGIVEAFRRKRAESGIDPVFGHMPYIMNLASPHDEVYDRSVESLSVGNTPTTTKQTKTNTHTPHSKPLQRTFPVRIKP